MGCFWSDTSSIRDRYAYTERQQPVRQPRFSDQPQFGSYRCYCGRHWTSRLAWANSYQRCKRCRRNVYPRELRPFQPSDMSKDREFVQEHAKELCQRCQQMGQYCGYSRKPSKYMKF